MGIMKNLAIKSATKRFIKDLSLMVSLVNRKWPETSIEVTITSIAAMIFNISYKEAVVLYEECPSFYVMINTMVYVQICKELSYDPSMGTESDRQLVVKTMDKYFWSNSNLMLNEKACEMMKVLRRTVSEEEVFDDRTISIGYNPVVMQAVSETYGRMMRQMPLL